MILLVVFLAIWVVAFLFGYFIVAPLSSGHPPFTSPDASAIIEVWHPSRKRRWPPYRRSEVTSG